MAECLTPILRIIAAESKISLISHRRKYNKTANIPSTRQKNTLKTENAYVDMACNPIHS